MPYYRRAVDPRFLKPNRDYVPNFKSNRSFEKTQERITEKYLAFFEEHRPSRSGRSCSRTTSERKPTVSRLLVTGRRNNASRVLEAAEEIVAPRRPAAAGEPDESPAPTRTPRRGAAATDACRGTVVAAAQLDSRCRRRLDWSFRRRRCRRAARPAGAAGALPPTSSIAPGGCEIADDAETSVPPHRCTPRPRRPGDRERRPIPRLQPPEDR